MSFFSSLLTGTAACAATATMLLGAAPASADDLDKIKDAGVIRIAMSGAYPPLQLRQ